jgi:hypothetical protein
LHDLQSISSFLKSVISSNIIVRGLINSAGAIDPRSMAINHIGHMALTMGLLPSLRNAANFYGRSYIVNVASVAHIDGSFHLSRDLDNLMSGVSSDKWTEYAGSKAANVIFGLSFQRKYLSNSSFKQLNDKISMYSIHPGVMLTDLWRTSDKISHDDDEMRSLIQKASCLCVKHPRIAAIGVSSIVDPRFCFKCSFDLIPSSIRTLCLGGSSGGYFQQACCCCLVPVRPSPVLSDISLQDKFWNQSVAYIQQNYENWESSFGSLDEAGDETSGWHVDTALPFTEVFAAFPYCLCVSCLC